MSDQDSVDRARQYGERGERLPSDMRGDPAYEAAHQEGRTARKLARRGDSTRTSEGLTHPLVRRRPATPAPPSTSAASPARSASKVRRGAGRVWAGASRTNAGIGRGRGIAAKMVPTGDAGGLLLVLVLYPMFLSIVKYGGSGPGIWFRAKWLNQPTAHPQRVTGPQPAPARPSAPGHAA